MSGQGTNTFAVVLILVTDHATTDYCILMQIVIGDALCVGSNFYQCSSLMTFTALRGSSKIGGWQISITNSVWLRLKQQQLYLKSQNGSHTHLFILLNLLIHLEMNLVMKESLI